MIKTLTLILLIIGTSTCFGQTKTRFMLKRGYRIEGVIFPCNFPIGFKINGLAKRFTPQLVDVKNCEKYLLMNLSIVKYVNLDGYYLPSGLKNKFKNHKRQYVGFINSEKDSIILIQLINFGHPHQAEKKYARWEKELIIGFDGGNEDNLKRLQVNLSRRQVSLY